MEGKTRLENSKIISCCKPYWLETMYVFETRGHANNKASDFKEITTQPCFMISKYN